jgi:hypothetical protein
MNLELLFLIANGVALVGWLPLFLGMRTSSAVGFARVVAALLAASYLILFLFSADEARVLARDYSLRGIGAFFSHPWLQLLGWVHYLALDLFVGSWEAEEARRAELPHLLVLACLILTFMLGPLGLLAFMLLLAWKRRRPHR